MPRDAIGLLRMSAGFLAVLGLLAGLVVAFGLLAVGLNSVEEGDNPVLMACLVGALLSLAVGPLLALRLGRRR